MVDGMLVLLFAKPGFFGSSRYDRKSNYSMNIQVSTYISSYQASIGLTQKGDIYTRSSYL